MIQLVKQEVKLMGDNCLSLPEGVLSRIYASLVLSHTQKEYPSALFGAVVVLVSAISSREATDLCGHDDGDLRRVLVKGVLRMSYISITRQCLFHLFANPFTQLFSHYLTYIQILWISPFLN